MNVIGIRSITYYLGNYLADMILFLIPCIIFVILLFPIGESVFSTSWALFLCIFACFGFELIALTYLIGFMFS